MTARPLFVFIGFDTREAAAFAVARESIRKFDRHIPINGVILSDLQACGMYTRPTSLKPGVDRPVLWDEISAAPMSTEFAISRFLVPEIIRKRTRGWHAGGWALFMDCDVLVRAPLEELRKELDDSKALFCVHHDYTPKTGAKMDGQVQTDYPRKNWSSVMAINVDHPANRALNAGMVNAMPGRDLHRFCWLKDHEIGALSPEWNYLVGITQGVENPKLVHFTEGGPWFEAYRNVPYANEWIAELERWAK